VFLEILISIPLFYIAIGTITRRYSFDLTTALAGVTAALVIYLLSGKGFIVYATVFVCCVTILTQFGKLSLWHSIAITGIFLLIRCASLLLVLRPFKWG